LKRPFSRAFLYRVAVLPYVWVFVVVVEVHVVMIAVGVVETSGKPERCV
jgi:hypothetical protein